MAETFSNPLHQAILTRNLTKIKKLVKIKNIEINQLDELLGAGRIRGKIHPLFLTYYRVYRDYKNIGVQIFKLLLSHPNMDVNISYSEGISLSSLSTAVYGNPPEDTSHFSLLHQMISDGVLEAVKAFVKHPKIDVNDVSTGLIRAIWSQNLCKPSNEKLQNDIIKVLLKHPNIDVNKKNESVRKYAKTFLGEEEEGIVGTSALHYAISKGQVKNVETLLKHPKILVNESTMMETKVWRTPLTIAMTMHLDQNPLDIAKLLLQHPDIDINKTDDNLSLAINFLVFDEITLSFFELLLNHKGVDINMKDKFWGSGVTPLMCLVSDKRRLTDDSNYKNEEDFDEDWDNRNYYPNAFQFHNKAVKLLLNHPKLDLTIQDDRGQNILHHLVMDEDKYDIISYLLEKNPELITPDKNGKTPIDLANEVPDNDGLMKDLVKKYNEQTKAECEANSSDNMSSKSDKDLKSANDLKKCCWNCDATDSKLYKCSGCKKAYYCSKDCLEHDWTVHGGYCVKKQQKKRIKNAQLN